MTKEPIVVIVYNHYKVSAEDAAALLAISLRAIKVSRQAWDKPFRPTEDTAPFCTSVVIRDFEPEPPAVSSAETAMAPAPSDENPF